MEQQTVTNSAVIHGLCTMHIKSVMHYSLRLAPTMMTSTPFNCTVTKSLIDVFFSLTKMTGSDRRAFLSKEWLWTVSYRRYLHTFQLHRLNHWLMFFFSYKDDRLRQTSTLVPGVIMNCKLHTIFTHLSTTQWLNHWLMFFFFYKGNQFGQTSTLVPGVIMNCKLHTIFTHLSTTQRLNHWLMAFFLLQR